MKGLMELSLSLLYIIRNGNFMCFRDNSFCLRKFREPSGREVRCCGTSDTTCLFPSTTRGLLMTV